MDRPTTTVPYIEGDDGTLIVDTDAMALLMDKATDALEQSDEILRASAEINEALRKKCTAAVECLQILIEDLELRAHIGQWTGNDELDHDIQCSDGIYQKCCRFLEEMGVR